MTMKRIREGIKAVWWETTFWLSHWSRIVWWKVNDVSCDLLEMIDEFFWPEQEFDPEKFDPENHE